MTHEEKKAMVEKLKINKMPWCFLEKEEQDFLAEHPEQTLVLTHDGFAPKNTRNYATFHPTNVYRIAPDFVLPEPEKERLFYRESDHKLLSSLDNFGRSGTLIEVPEAYVWYVQKCIELHKTGKVDLNEFEFRELRNEKASWISAASYSIIFDCDADGSMRFVRKQPAKVKPFDANCKVTLPTFCPSRFVEEFNAIQKDVHQNAKDKGWHDSKRNDGEMIALMHSELSEALEALRHGNPFDDKIPEYSGVEAELADVVIRIMDYAELRGFRVAKAIIAKHQMNKTREHKHGGKEF